MAEVAIEMADLRNKLGDLLVQQMVLERRIADLERENGELRARESERVPAPAAVLTHPWAQSGPGETTAAERAELMGSA